MTAPYSPDNFNAPEQILAPEWLLLRDKPVQGQALLVSQGNISAVGSVAELQRQAPGVPLLSLPGRLIMPGFIDTHHHLTQAFGKALVFGEPSEIFRRIWVPLEASLDEDFLYLSSKLAALEALRGGFTTVCDAGTRSAAALSSIARATEEAGIRCVLGMVCNDKQGTTLLDKSSILARADRHISAWQGSGQLVSPSLAIPIPEIATDEMLHAISSLCREAGIIFQTHANEHLVAVERSLEQRGQRPVEHLYHAGALGPQTLLAHATLLTPTEIRMIQQTDTAVSYNPVASAWKGNAVAQAELMHAFNIRLGLGTDGTRSDGFRLMDYAEAAQRFAFGMAAGDSSCGGGWPWLEKATLGGADVLGLGRKTGEIAAGRAADFLLIDLEVPEMVPSWDLSWELVRLANRDQIEGVFVDGKLRLWQGWPLDWDARALMRQVSAEAKAGVAGAPIQKIHSFSDQHRQQHAERSRRHPGSQGPSETLAAACSG
ncbi:S-adenosylhomocysteine deaminase [Marinobacterium aestuarii]|uniref:S-adenosylhomocysteine deaminase n=1 Tax=Marinobacterium aestuarii TaxID=1821621 RepID=A0A1A9F144_9GAMM|nr:amidohydrolase family protein [Marinobacterium aestuarii]ANG63611.1 S-adenosylhomocysteine deaminase [Marinobacterium aestuarii]